MKKTFIEVNKKRIRKDAQKGDLLEKTKNGWYRPVKKETHPGVIRVHQGLIKPI
jgi:hypothetical protein